MRIMLVNTFLPPVQVGGAEESVLELAISLHDQGHHVAVACLGPPWNEKPEIVPPGVTVFRLNNNVTLPYFSDRSKASKLSKLAWHLREACRPTIARFLRDAIKEFRPEVVHTNSIAGFGTEAWRAVRALPLVHTLRDYQLVCVSSRTFKNGRNCQSQCLECRAIRLPMQASRKPDVFVSLSNATLKRHVEFGYLPQTATVAVVANQPSIAGFVRDTRTQLGQVYGFLGRIEAYKGIEIAIRSFGTMEDPHARLIVAGDGSSKDVARLRSMMQQDPRIEYLGRVPPTEFYARANVVLVPSQWHEPFGRVAAEAASVGAAVIVSGIGGLPEAIEGYDNTYVVEQYWSTEAWSEAMVEFSRFKPPLHVTPGTGRPRKSVVERYEEIYLQTLNSHSSGRTLR